MKDSHEVFEDVVPFSGLPQVSDTAEKAPIAISAERAVAEVQGMMAIAKRFPRDQKKAFDRIIVACQRPSLAERALYSYSRGGTDITGPSIRLAEAIAQNWGNISFGIQEIEQRLGESVVEAFAWDMETNTKQTKVFQVKHRRKTKKGSYDLEDPRDIYEMVANMGSRRMRACILGIIPGDVVDAAVEQCEATLKAKADVSPEAIKKMVDAFRQFGVDKSQIEARIQRKLDAITAAQVVALRKIYNSLKDGMSRPDDWFEVVAKEEPKKEMQPVQPVQSVQPEQPSPSPEPKKERKQRSDKGTHRGVRPSHEEKEPPEAVSALHNNKLVDPETVHELNYYCSKLGLNPDKEAAKYREDGSEGVKFLKHDEAGKMLGALLDQMSIQ